jgi:hypothetical protein
MPSLPDGFMTAVFLRRFTRPYEEWPAFKAGIIDAHGNIIKKRRDLTPEEDKLFGNYDRVILNLRKILAKVPGGSSRLGILAAAALLLKEGESLDYENVDLLKEKLDNEMSKVSHNNLLESIRFRSAFANHETPEGWMVPHHVDAWHQSRANGWCVQVLDKHGNQVGEAEYHYHKKDAMHAKKQLSALHKLHEEMGAAAISAGTPANNVGAGKIAGTKEAGDDPPVRKNAAAKYKRKNKKFSSMPFARREGANNG